MITCKSIRRRFISTINKLNGLNSGFTCLKPEEITLTSPLKTQILTTHHRQFQ